MMDSVVRITADHNLAPDLARSDALLRDLVQALDSAFISSWQSTARWQEQLDRAREHIDNFSREKGQT